ncbi:MAG: FtsX-like permease family protein [Lewinellaceae bacterium]|nr:FtsX-like permease family protein [Lewinellaceae bacterium]
MRSTQDKSCSFPCSCCWLFADFGFNVGLGLFGVLFQTISRRKGEIGLRRALGATKQAIQLHFMSETIMIASFGVVLGLFFAIQIPLLQVFDLESDIYGWAMLLGNLINLVVHIALCRYPSRLAAGIYPATVLHEE